MIINCGKRRLTSYRYGWMIEIQVMIDKGQHKGELVWREDRPAYPANLEQGLEMICERELTDGPDTAIADLPERLRQASKAVRHYMELARKAA